MSDIKSPFQNNNNNQNNNIPQSSNHKRPPPSKKQISNNNTTSPGINSPFGQQNQNFNAPFNPNTNNNYNNNYRKPSPPKNYTPTPTPNSNYNNNQQREEKQEEDSDSNDNANDTNNNETSEQKHKTSQKHKTPDQNYSINPSQIPRPNQYDEIYLNNEKMPIYETNIATPPPHPISFFSVKETQNSSPRFIRSTLNSVPLSQSLLNETNLLFGLCIQPFAEVPEYEDPIPKVQQHDQDTQIHPFWQL